MESNGSWLVPTHLAAGIDFGIAPLPAGPAGQATSINPTGVVVAAATKAPDAAWEFVKYLVGPEAQTQLMQLKAAVPVDKSVLARPATPRRSRARTCSRRRIAFAAPEALVPGLQRVDDRAPGGARHQRLQRPQQDGA